MSKTVFIFGAGTSVDAGAPVMRNFLDVAEDLLRAGGDLRDREAFEAVFRGIHRLQGAFAKSRIDVENLESVFVAFEMGALLYKLGDLPTTEVMDLPRAMRKLIVGTLEEKIQFNIVGGYVRAKEPYEQFAKFASDSILTDPASVSVITFNYDCILDYALVREGLNIDYALDLHDSTDARRIDVLKLHGSLNWLIGPVANQPEGHRIHIAKLQSVGERAPGIYPSDDNRTARMRTSEIAARGVATDALASAWEPLIVPPTWSKAEHHRRLTRVWQRAARHLSEAETIVICGYSLPPTDEFFRYLFALGTISPTRLRHVYVFDAYPSDEMNKRFGAMLGPMASTRYVLKERNFRMVAESLSSGGIANLQNLLPTRNNRAYG